MRLWVTTSAENFSSEFDEIEQMFERGLSRLILQKRGRGSSTVASEAEYERWLLSLPMEFRDHIWIRGTPDLANRLEVRGAVTDFASIADNVPESWKRIDCIALCRSTEQLSAIPEWVSGAMIGPVFQPQSALEIVQSIGIDHLSKTLGEIPPEKLPKVIAFGGIDHDNLSEIKKLPLQGISLLGGIWNYADPVNAAIKMLRSVQG